MTSIHFVVSTPAHPTFTAAPSSGTASPPPRPFSAAAGSKAPGPFSSWSRTSSWARQSAIAGFTLPPLSPPPSSDWGDQGAATDRLHTSVRFLQDRRLSLIHIPLHLYPYFVQRLVSLVIPESSPVKDTLPETEGLDGGAEAVGRLSSESSVASDFVNISITPVECSVVCSKKAASRLFVPLIKNLDPAAQSEISISDEEFVAVQVDGEGLDAGQRVLDLTSPLALAGVPIFFITTYFSDYIIVPAKKVESVRKALRNRGFVFEEYSDSYVASPAHHRHTSSTSSLNIPPPTPPPTTTLGDLESRTFATLRKQNVSPQVVRDTKLVLCAGRRPSGKGKSGDEDALKLGLIKCFVQQPRFMSITFTDAEPASLLLQKEMLPMFDGDSDILLGSKEDVLIPIVLDLRGLPIDSTGIVCGVAGRLIGGTKGEILDGTQAVEMSYLSTARAGTVMVAEDDIERAMAALDM